MLTFFPSLLITRSGSSKSNFSLNAYVIPSVLTASIPQPLYSLLVLFSVPTNSNLVYDVPAAPSLLVISNSVILTFELSLVESTLV